MINTSVDFMRIDLDSVDVSFISKDIKEWYEIVKTKDFKGVKKIDNKIYALISLGEKNSGGYNVTLNKIEKIKDQLIVYYLTHSPTDSETIISSFSYPYELVAINLSDVDNKDIDKLIVIFKEIQQDE